MKNSLTNNKTQQNLNDKLLEMLNKRVILASYVLSPFYKINKFEHSSDIELVKNPQWNRVNDLLINKTIPGTPYKNLLTFRDTH